MNLLMVNVFFYDILVWVLIEMITVGNFFFSINPLFLEKKVLQDQPPPYHQQQNPDWDIQKEPLNIHLLVWALVRKLLLNFFNHTFSTSKHQEYLF